MATATRTKRVAKKKVIDVAPSKALGVTVDMDVSAYTHKAMLEYGSYVIENRAIPSGMDGLKPVQRCLLWAAHTLGLSPNKGFRKGALVVGECFTAKTDVSMADGSFKNITLITEGDLVKTSSGEGRVTTLFQIAPRPLLKVVLANGSDNEATEAQMFKVVKDGNIVWLRADELQVGDDVIVE